MPASRQFNRHWSRRVLPQGAVVLLITDGLEQEVGEGLAREMERLRKSSKRLIWLNPLLRWDESQAAGQWYSHHAAVRGRIPSRP